MTVRPIYERSVRHRPDNQRQLVKKESQVVVQKSVKYTSDVLTISPQLGRDGTQGKQKFRGDVE